MTKKQGLKTINPLRKVLLSLLSIVGVFFLLYGYIVIQSIAGRESITIGEIERKYRVFIPSTYDERHPVPLLIVFHMLTGSGKTTEWLTHFNEIAEGEGFIVVYPDGYKASWAEGSNLYAADQDQIDDVAFVSALVDKLFVEYAIYPDQIYAAGFSSGGFMVQRLGCELSNKISAIATVGATFSINTYKDCNPQHPVPILMIHGTEDHGVPMDGDVNYVSVPETVDYWIAQNGCSSAPIKSQLPDTRDDETAVESVAYLNCLENSQVILYTIVGGGHTWPGGNQAVQLWGLNGKISQDIDASQAIWEFFQEQK